MRRLLQFGTLCLFLAAFLTPLAECFDRWDPPGLSNDTEFAIFMFVLGLALVLVVSRLLAVLALIFDLMAQPHRPQLECAVVPRASWVASIFIPPLSPPPLRI